MELGVGEALVSFLDANGVPSVVQRTSVICPQSLMAMADSSARQAAQAESRMEKYDESVDNISAYELISEQKEKDAERAQLEAERAQLEKEKAEFEKQKQKEAAVAEKKKEQEQAKKDKAAQQRKARIERQLISTGGQILKRGLMNTLFKK